MNYLDGARTRRRPNVSLASPSAAGRTSGSMTGGRVLTSRDTNPAAREIELERLNMQIGVVFGQAINKPE
jgi:hypothetical protein